MRTDHTVVVYFIYLPTVLLLTWYVARTLFRNGLVFMRDIFNGREEIALATNALFRIGFYLLNVGFSLYILEIYQSPNDTREIIEILSTKIGGFSIYLGVMLFFNLFLFFRGKKAARQRHEQQLALQHQGELHSFRDIPPTTNKGTL